MPLSLEDAIKSRRTSKDFDGTEIPKALIEKSLNLAILAPNHRMNQPWKFRVYSKAAVQKFISTLQSGLNDEDKKSFEGPFSRLAKVGAMIVVTVQKDEHPTVDLENYAAACAAVQNILLYMTSENVGTYWSTAKILTHPLAMKFFEMTETERFVGGIWLGKGPAPEAKPRKPITAVTDWF